MCGMERLSNEALPVQAMVLLHPKEVPLCLSGTVSKICWRFYTGTLRRRLTRSHSILGALSMAICRWDSKSTVWATGASSLLWWKVLEEHTLMTRRHFGVRVPWLSRGDACAVERAADPLNRAGVYSKPGSNLAHAISASRSRPMDGCLMWFSKGGLIKEMFLKSLRWHGRAGDQDHRRLYLQAVAARRVTPSR
jgi:hypothetical protein